MIGQEKIINQLNNYTLKTLPHNILFLGQIGSGKKTLVKYLANKLKLPIVSINDKIEEEKVNEYFLNPISTIYLIDIDQMFGDSSFNLKVQSLLKFIEEPTESMYVMLTSSLGNKIPETILNRCIKFTLEDYTKEQLKQIKQCDDYVYDICKTPGQLLTIGSDEKILKNTFDLCTKLINDLKKATITNFLSITYKINYTNEYDETKIDFYLFFQVLLYISYKEFIEHQNDFAYKIYQITQNRFKEYKESIKKENFMMNFLLKLWQEGKNAA